MPLSEKHNTPVPEQAAAAKSAVAFSVVCCSVNLDAAAALEQNIAQTIGVPFEFIAFDNRTAKMGLCSVYNQCASRAKYDLLCFVHEDVRFTTDGWGDLIAVKLHEASCGVVGFAGSILKLRRLTGWNTCGRDLRANYVQHMRGKGHLRRVNPECTDFSPVVTLDGFCLCVRRDVWAATPFDEQTFPGFHGYDIDFSLAVARDHTNYVCHTVLAEHFSQGAFSINWLAGMECLHAKWERFLPMMAGTLTPRQLAAYDRWGEAYFIRFMFQKGLFGVKGLRDAVGFILRHPLTPSGWALIPKYVKYKLRAVRSKSGYGAG